MKSVDLTNKRFGRLTVIAFDSYVPCKRRGRYKNGNANVTVEMRLSLIKTHWLMEALKVVVATSVKKLP